MIQKVLHQPDRFQLVMRRTEVFSLGGGESALIQEIHFKSELYAS